MAHCALISAIPDCAWRLYFGAVSGIIGSFLGFLGHSRPATTSITRGTFDTQEWYGAGAWRNSHTERTVFQMTAPKKLNDYTWQTGDKFKATGITAEGRPFNQEFSSFFTASGAPVVKDGKVWVIRNKRRFLIYRIPAKD